MTMPTSLSGSERGDDVSLIGVITVLLRRLPVILGCGALLAGLVVLINVRKPQKYTATASFIPEGGSQASGGLSGLAAQFGITVPGAAGGASATFYLDLLQSRVLLRRVVQSQFDVATDSGRIRGDLIQIYGLRSGSPLARLQGAIGLLRKNVDATVEKNTGGVQLAVSAPNAGLARDLANRLLEQINAYNVEVRQSQASLERQYSEQRMDDARTQLHAAEDRLAQFLEQNRTVASPQLRLAQERMEREISVRQQLYLTVSEAYEQSRLAEVRDTPTITVLELPDLPLQPDSKHLLQFGILSFVAGAFVGILLAFILEFFARSRAERTPEMMELVATVDAISSRLRAPARLVRPSK